MGRCCIDVCDVVELRCGVILRRRLDDLTTNGKADANVDIEKSILRNFFFIKLNENLYSRTKMMVLKHPADFDGIGEALVGRHVEENVVRFFILRFLAPRRQERCSLSATKKHSCHSNSSTSKETNP